MSTKIYKILITIILSIALLYALNYFISLFNKSHKLDQFSKRYYELFCDTIQDKIDSKLCSGYVGKNDVFYRYKYKSYRISIWEFFNAKDISLSQITYNYNVDMTGVEISPYEAFNNLYPRPYITLKIDMKLNSYLKINLDKNSQVINLIDSNNYKGFFGNISMLSISDNSEHLILFDYKRNILEKGKNDYKFKSTVYEKIGCESTLSMPTLFLFYKYSGSLFLIIINSTNNIDKNIIKILNLS